ncbi:MAG: hypothetical protein LBM73_00795 [Candidatus Nomurabacteria bacterium]|nr:hypothetical protein [Candidatus Nomurabacteria bacterium]
MKKSKKFGSKRQPTNFSQSGQIPFSRGSANSSQAPATGQNQIPFAKNLPKHHRARRLFTLIIGVAVLAGGCWLYLNRQFIQDQITVWTFQPGQNVKNLATDSGMNAKGEFYYLAARPQISGAATFNRECPAYEKSITLGCYTGGRIYVYDVENVQLTGVKAVTAAHEMLHSAYARLNPLEKSDVDKMLESAFASVNDPAVLDQMAVYKKAEPGQFDNELHSVLATEVRNLPANLENYYQKYFADRARAVRLYQNYNAVFTDLKNQESQLKNQLADLKKQIDSGTANYEAARQNLQSQIFQFNACAARTNCFASQNDFNSERQNLLNQQTALNAQAAAVNNLIGQYNQIADRLNALGQKQQTLQNSLDSHSAAIAG